MSIPTAKYEINGTTLYYYSGKNNYRAPDYHQLDLSATWHLKNITDGNMNCLSDSTMPMDVTIFS